MNEVLTALKRGAAFGNSGLTLSPRHSLMKSWKRAFMRQAVWIVKKRSSSASRILTSSPDFPVPMPRLQAIKKGRILFMGPGCPCGPFTQRGPDGPL